MIKYVYGMVSSEVVLCSGYSSKSLINDDVVLFKDMGSHMESSKA